MRKEDFISIVVPVYNVEFYLRKCLDSIINQTYKKIEIILIDDGSTDDSGKICDEYAKKDSRIKVIHKENGGLSDARNVGIANAIGKYITFIDSDDYVDVDYVEYLYNLIKKYNTDISFCKFQSIFNNKKINKIINGKSNKWDKIKTFSDVLYASNFDVSACGKMYLTEQFKNINFPKGKLFEDNDTIYKLIDKNEFVAVGFDAKYNYMIRNESITRRKFNEKQLYLIEASDNMCKELSKYDSLKKAIKRKMFWARISTLNRMINSNNRNFEDERKLRKEIIRYKSVIFDSKSSFRDKVSIILLFFGVSFYKKFWNLYLKIREIK